MRTPCLVINFKAFKEGTGKSALKIAKEAEKISNKLNVCIAISPNFFDLKEIAKKSAYLLLLNILMLWMKEHLRDMLLLIR